MMRCVLACLFVVMLAACWSVEDTRPGRPVAHRQEAFKAILRAFEPMGMQLRDNAFTPETFLYYANELDKIKDTPWEFFGADTQYPPSKSKDRLWEEKARFEAMQDDFKRLTEALKTTAEGRDETRIRAAWHSVENSCRECHKAYRK